MNRRTAKKKLSNSDEWSTPPALFDALSLRYGPFDLDVAADAHNAKAPRFFTKKDSALGRPWNASRVFMNPPYSRGQIPLFVGSARVQILDQATEDLICSVVPGHTAEAWWHDLVEAPPGKDAGRVPRCSWFVSDLGVHTRICWPSMETEIVRLSGRQAFIEKSGVTGSARFPSCVVVFAQPGAL